MNDEPRAPLRRVVGLFRPYRGRLAIVGGLIGLSSLISLASPFMLREVLDDAIPNGRTGLLTLLALGMVAVAVTTSVLDVVQTMISAEVGQRVMHDLRTAVYGHLQRMSLAFFTRTRTGEVQSRIAGDIGGMQQVVTSTAASIVSNLTTVVATVVAMLVLDWRLTVVSLLLLPLFVGISRKVGRERRRITSERQRKLAAMSATVQESLSISGILLGRTMGRGPELAGRFATASEELAGLEVRAGMAGRWRQSTIQIIMAAMPAMIYWTIGLAPVVSIGTVVAFTTLQATLFRPAVSLLRLGVEVQSSLALFARIFEYLDLPVDIHPGPRTLARVRGEIRFEHVHFSYGDTPALSDVDLTVPAGTTLALVGETGSGKTTLSYLLPRLYDVTGGRITIDGVDVRELTFETLAETVGVVSQETYLFHASIADNLRFAKPSATDEEIAGAARAARIHDHVMSLPDGYDTVVGERGYRFSGGEKQRLAIARTLLRNPPVLILDEATSALDTRTERAVQEALDTLSRGRTTIMIAHRLSTIREADQIAVLDRGRVAERGTHEELLAAGGRYTALVDRDRSLASA
ncbi:ATP-binding cassette subfamily B protein [Streptosporangium becharense]|uniref:ATP-binding cassette subfamily B protein n=1 Tax=Streptosporangium becharense TaxID=1816182 RepID=A0A7W9MJ57_9ACTN|nr:ABC transporter ATP-binding protein [Streptosporangium becharense]MBB2913313.1 ATP-binding cassette subfamily B protein [Streptosporangium becharense]MBB5822296.1 ATP-binding cassette subfamily B protein [Streptosporangium becharense]